MNFKLTLLSFSVSSALLLSACSVTPFDKEMQNKPLQTTATPLVVERSASYLREVTPDELLLSKKVSVTGRMSLIDAIRKQVEGVNIVPGDTNVEMNQEVLIYAQEMSLAEYLTYLESVTGYDIEYSSNVVTVRSFVHRQWNLSSFASKRNVRLSVGSTFNFKNTSVSDGASTTSTSNDNKVSTEFDDDEWKMMIESAETILGVKDKKDKGKDHKELQKPFVQALAQGYLAALAWRHRRHNGPGRGDFRQGLAVQIDDGAVAQIDGTAVLQCRLQQVGVAGFGHQLRIGHVRQQTHQAQPLFAHHRAPQAGLVLVGYADDRRDHEDGSRDHQHSQLFCTHVLPV